MYKARLVGPNLTRFAPPPPQKKKKIKVRIFFKVDSYTAQIPSLPVPSSLFPFIIIIIIIIYIQEFGTLLHKIRHETIKIITLDAPRHCDLKYLI